MAIKNYTSSVDVYVSLGEIQGALAGHGARQIIEGVLEVFRRQKVKADRKQAERTGWRNLRDWVLAQMAIIESGMVCAEEVFLPYMTDGRGNTVYSLYAAGQLALTGAEGVEG